MRLFHRPAFSKAWPLTWAATLLVAIAGGGCGGSTSSPTNSPPTVTLTASGANPRAVTIAVGAQVTFTNQDSRLHAIASNPHPVHTDCPAINNVGNLPAGQTKITGVFSTSATCGYHDHEDPENPNFHGSITIR